MQLSRSLDLANNSRGMRIFEGRYFNINRKLLMCFGLWPYEMRVKKIVIRTIIIGAIILLAIPQLISITLHYKSMDRLMLNVLTFLSLLVVMLKVVGMILAEENMMKLHKSIADNWQLIQVESERDVLFKYSERARTISIFYGAAILTSGAIASTLPLLPKFLDIVSPLDNPRPEIYLMEGEYFTDRRSHFLPLFFVDYFAIMLSALIVVTVDTMFIVSVEHCCVLFKIIRNRLLELKRAEQKNPSATGDDDSYEWLRRTIQLHQDALTFTLLLRDSYSRGFLFVMVASLIICPLASCAIIANIHDLLNLLPYAIYYLVLMIHGIFFFYPGQRIIDHQLSLLDAAYYNEWYVIPLRTRKMLLIFMLRCSEPATLSAGGILPINFEVYFKLLKTTLSYITVASSFR